MRNSGSPKAITNPATADNEKARNYPLLSCAGFHSCKIRGQFCCGKGKKCRVKIARKILAILGERRKSKALGAAVRGNLKQK
jgi:hypothetical protein